MVRKKYLTQIEDLSEFIHEIDPDVDAKLDSQESESEDVPDLPTLDDLEDDGPGTQFDEEKQQEFSSEDDSFETDESKSICQMMTPTN